MAQTLRDNHYTPTVEAALRFQRIRLRSRAETAALADEIAALRADVKQKREAWEEAFDEARAAAADVVYSDSSIDACVKLELKAAVAVLTSTMTAKQRDAVTAKLYGGKSPSEGMKNVGGPAQQHYVDAILGHLATPEFASLKAIADKLTTLRDALAAAEANRTTRRTAEQVSRSALEDSVEAAKRAYNQMNPRLTLLLPDDPDFVESCFLDLRAAGPDQGSEARKRALLGLYRARLGAVPRELSAALDEEIDEAKFAKLIDVFARETAEAIAAAVIPKKPA